MALPLLAIATALEKTLNVAFSKGAHDAIRGLWGRTRWARDAAKTAVVERKVDEVLNDARQIARNVSAVEVPAALEKRIGSFERDLRDLGLSDEEARNMGSELRRQIDDGVVGPMRELKLLEERLTEVERAATSAEGAVVGLRAEITRLRVWLYGAAVCAFLSLFALLVALAVMR